MPSLRSKRPRLPYTSKKVARRAKRSRGAYAQSRQIATLSRQISKVAEISSVPLQLRWQRTDSKVDRDILSVQNSGQMGNPYICPIPVAPSQIAIANLANFGDNGPTIASDAAGGNDVGNAANDFKKGKVWVTAVDANQKPRCTHRGGYLSYKLTRTNLSLRHVTVMLVRAKTVVADQLSLQRAFQYFAPAVAGGAAVVNAGNDSRMVPGYDYIHIPSQNIYDPIAGYQMNPQMWDVLGKQTYRFGTNKPMLDPIVNPAGRPTTIGTPMRTEATGYFKLPSGGAVHKIFSADHTQQATNLDYANQRSEKNVFLVIFSQRGNLTPSAADGVPVADTNAGELSLAFQVRDNYTCSEGSLTPMTGGGGAGGPAYARGRKRRRR